eukprot:CFRG5473T1
MAQKDGMVDQTITSSHMSSTTTTGALNGGQAFMQRSVIRLCKENGRVGLGLGGGAPLCPVVYVYRLIPDSPASRQTSLHCGDEILSINNTSVMGKTSAQVAQLVTMAPSEVVIEFINFDLVDTESSKSAANLSIWVNAGILRFSDSIKRQSNGNEFNTTASVQVSDQHQIETESFKMELEAFNRTAEVATKFLKEFDAYGRSVVALGTAQRYLGETLSANGAMEKDLDVSQLLHSSAKMYKQCGASFEAVQFTTQGLSHSIQTFTEKVAPDAQVTIDKYLAARDQYAAIVITLHSMEDEEIDAKERNTRIPRCDQGNLKFRRYVRMKERLQEQLVELQTDVVEKLQLLDQKHDEIITDRFSEMITTLQSTYETLGGIAHKPTGIISPNIQRK